MDALEEKKSCGNYVVKGSRLPRVNTSRVNQSRSLYYIDLKCICMQPYGFPCAPEFKTQTEKVQVSVYIYKEILSGSPRAKACRKGKGNMQMKTSASVDSSATGNRKGQRVGTKKRNISRKKEREKNNVRLSFFFVSAPSSHRE